MLMLLALRQATLLVFSPTFTRIQSLFDVHEVISVLMSIAIVFLRALVF